MPNLEPGRDRDHRDLSILLVWASLFSVGHTWWCEQCESSGFEPLRGERRRHRPGCRSKDAQ